ncbi:MAG: dihydroorotate dehydrogenase electron transfer subunit [Candidatus Peregrinibacteria bacterium]
MPTYTPEAFTIAKKFHSAENVWTFVFEGTLNSTPGQFVNVWIPGVNEKPFSIARDWGNEIWLTVCAVGPFSKALCEKQVGDRVGIRGPYGKGFQITPLTRGAQMEAKTVVLVGGGYGMAPLHNAGIAHQKNGATVIAITGARSAKNVLFVEECKNSGFETFITTDDGTLGQKGFTTDILDKLLEERKIDLVQTCGPEKMMKRIAEKCRAKGVLCEVSIERYMKCGFGVCGQCTVDGTGERMCKSGPAVDGNYALDNIPEFGMYHRGPEGQKVLW